MKTLTEILDLLTAIRTQVRYQNDGIKIIGQSLVNAIINEIEIESVWDWNIKADLMELMTAIDMTDEIISSDNAAYSDLMLLKKALEERINIINKVLEKEERINVITKFFEKKDQ